MSDHAGTDRHLLLMRHAKSSWSDETLDDHDRPLNKRGRAAAEFMASLILHRGLAPDAILCSTAIRTRMTLEPLLSRMTQQVYLSFTPTLYETDRRTYLRVIQEIAAQTDAQRLLVVGHNEMTHELALTLSGDGSSGARLAMEQKFPTGAVALFRYSGEAPQVGNTQLLDFLRPRELMS